MHLVYDGSFEGFLCAIYEIYTKSLHVESIAKQKSTSIFTNNYEIITSKQTYERVYNGIKKSFSFKHRQTITNIFLCENSDFERDLIVFIKLGFKNQSYLEDITISSIFKLKELEKELFRVVHRMYGFIRFEELEDGTLYGKFSNKFNILPFLAKHFSKRLYDETFILYDEQRKLAFIYKNHQGQMHSVHQVDAPTLSHDEEKFKQLWKIFFHRVSIKERENKKLQQQFVPLLYREYMSEFTS